MSPPFTWKTALTEELQDRSDEKVSTVQVKNFQKIFDYIRCDKGHDEGWKSERFRWGSQKLSARFFIFQLKKSGLRHCIDIFFTTTA